MTCDEARNRLLDARRGRLDPEALAALRGHLQTCAACAHEDAAEALLSEALEGRLPQHAAPVALKRRLAAEWPRPATAGAGLWRRWGRYLVPAAAVAAVLLIVVPLANQRASERAATRMVAEAVNDHLRILASAHPLDAAYAPEAGIITVQGWPGAPVGPPAWSPDQGRHEHCWRLKSQAHEIRRHIRHAPPWEQDGLEHQLWQIRQQARGVCPGGGNWG